MADILIFWNECRQNFVNTTSGDNLFSKTHREDKNTEKGKAL